ncbi:hypothetical protein [Zavarzinia sp. CC-PAN008]|uniref:hypothetical protein n=1 Tax=Zavarzinia sp. CC-PAN008 TaxID=3243332 RepID=UPI003F749360
MSEILDRARQAAEARRERQRRLLDLLRQVESRMAREGEARRALEASVASLSFERDEVQAALAQAADERDAARADLARAVAERDAARAEAAALHETIARLEASLGELVDLIEDDAQAGDPIVTLEALLRGDVPAGLGHNSQGGGGSAVELDAPAPTEVSEDGQVFSDASLVQFEVEDELAPAAGHDGPQADDARGDDQATDVDAAEPDAVRPPPLDADAERRLRVLEDFLEQGLVTLEEYERRRRELTRTAQTF